MLCKLLGAASDVLHLSTFEHRHMQPSKLMVDVLAYISFAALVHRLATSMATKRMQHFSLLTLRRAPVVWGCLLSWV